MYNLVKNIQNSHKLRSTRAKFWNCLRSNISPMMVLLVKIFGWQIFKRVISWPKIELHQILNFGWVITCYRTPRIIYWDFFNYLKWILQPIVLRPVIFLNPFLYILDEFCHERVGIINLDVGMFLSVLSWYVFDVCAFVSSYRTFIWYVLFVLSCSLYCYIYFYYLGCYTAMTNSFFSSDWMTLWLSRNWWNYIYIVIIFPSIWYKPQ